MKALTTLLGLGLASIAVAQSPLTTIYAGNASSNSNVGGVVFFNMTVNQTITISRIDVNSNSAAGLQGEIKLYQTNGALTSFSGSETTPANWTLLGTAPATAAGFNLATIACFPAPITLNPGTRGYAVVQRGLSTLYTVGTATNLNYSTAELTLNAGAAAGIGPFYPDGLALEFGAGANNPRVFNGAIHYTVGSSAAPCSYSSSVGTGCGGKFASFFDLYANGALASAALNGKAVVMSPNVLTGGNYQVYTTTSALFPTTNAVPLTGFATTIAANAGAPLDDGEVATPTLAVPFPLPGGGTATSLIVHTNGMVSTASNLTYLDTLAGDDWAPLVPALLAATNSAWYAWHDYDIGATGGGQILFEDIGGLVVITYLGVESYPTGAGNPSTIQFLFNCITGEVQIYFDSITATGAGGAGDPHLVGWSSGGASLRPPESDVNTLTGVSPLVLSALAGEGLDLALTAAPRPTFTSIINYTVANMPVGYGFPYGLLYFSIANPYAPGFPLSFLGVGQPGCLLNFDLNNPIGPFTFLAPGVALSVDTNTVTPSMLGLEFWSQAAVVDVLAANILDSVVSSNALHQRVELN